MFKEILVPVDLTDTHGHALDIARELAGQDRGQITLLHVVELIAGLSQEEGKDFYNRLENKARQHVETLAARLAAHKMACKSEVAFGNRAVEILRYAQQNGTDLIVLTSHRIDLQQGVAGLGTLSHKVGILAACPVLLVK